MKKTRFSEKKKIVLLPQEADDTSAAAVAKQYGVSEQTLYNWRKQFSGLAPSDVKRLRHLVTGRGRQENSGHIYMAAIQQDQ